MQQFGWNLVIKRLKPVFSWSFLSDKLYSLNEEHKIIFLLSVAPWDLPESPQCFIATVFTKYIFLFISLPLLFPATPNYNNSDGLGLYYTKFPRVAAWICTPGDQSKPLMAFLLWLQVLTFQFTTQIAQLLFLSWIFSYWDICVPPRAVGLWSGEWRGWSCWDHSLVTTALLLPVLFPPGCSAWKFLFLVYLMFILVYVMCKVPI